MDPRKALVSDQEGFERDLERMITDILSGSSTETPNEESPVSPQHDGETRAMPQKRTFAALTPPMEYSPAPPSVKRAKTDQTDVSSETYGTHMHPSRKAQLFEPPAASSDAESKFEHVATPRAIASAGPPTSATRANVTPLGIPPRPAKDTTTWSTLRNTIHRQWDPRKGDLDYEEVLKHRRSERLDGVDRYVPMWSPDILPKKSNMHPFPFRRLPSNVREKILSFLLVSDGPIEIEFNWLRPFVKGHARVPTVMQKLQSDDGTFYLAPVPWQTLLADVGSMKADMAQFRSALETRGVKTKGRRSPARYLTTSLLRVSRGIHTAAARLFYGENTFHFSNAPAAWMQLESFLQTIGPQNVKEIKHIRIAPPMFHRGIQEDYVEGAILDLMSPATRMAVIKPPPRDRLLSAIKHSVTKLMEAGSLETMNVDLEHPMASDLWSGRYVNDKRLINVAEAERHVERKAAGVALLMQASEALAAKGNRPVLTLYHFAKPSKSDRNQFRGAFAGLIMEAEKYGWRVHSTLHNGKE